jgi:hypothetical protein
VTDYTIPPRRTIRTARNMPAVKYYVVETGDYYVLRRDIGGQTEYWTGDSYGWMTAPAKRYKVFGTAKRALQIIQERDRVVMTARGRKRLMESKAAQLHEALRDLMEYVGGWDQPVSHPCGRAAALLRIIERGY